MAKCVVTGAAGFIGSHLCERLLADGHQVTGIDAFIPYYPRALKERNLSHAAQQPGFTFHELDLRTDDLRPAVQGADAVFHLAAMAGLLRSWEEFDRYMSCNIQATQRLLEATVEATGETGVGHFLYCSTSSVYGRYATGREDSRLQPVSPYGITKLAAEHLCQAYAERDGLPLTVLRLFSVYGPRQRPDMGYNIFINRILQGETIVVDGDGNDTRSNTYVEDCVDGILLAFAQPEQSVGETFNLGGGEEVSVIQVLALLEELIGKAPQITHGPPRPGDQKRTAADFGKAQQRLGYQPATSIREGLAKQLAWQKEQMGG